MTGRRRADFAVCHYVDWRLGPARPTVTPLAITRDESGALLARNPFHTDFSARTAFLDMAGPRPASPPTVRNSWAAMAAWRNRRALRRTMKLSGKTGLMPGACGALQTELLLAPGRGAPSWCCCWGRAVTWRRRAA